MASRAALAAPAAPMARVPTGTPLGICTMESSESMPCSAVAANGDAEHGEDGARGDHAGQMRGAAGSGDEDAEAAGGGGVGVAEHAVGGAVGGDDAGFVGDVELAQEVDRRAHDGVVVFAAHDDADERSGRHGEDYMRANGCPAGRAPCAGGGRSHALLRLRGVLPLVATELRGGFGLRVGAPVGRHGNVRPP